MVKDYLVTFLVCLIGSFTCISAQANCNGQNIPPLVTTWTINAATSTVTTSTVIYNGNTAATNAAEVKARWLTVNNKWPAEALHVKKCQRVTLTLQNNLDQQDFVPKEPVTLHFHGLLMSDGQVAMDGPEGLTQSGISPGKSFTYDFVADKEGTYWIHSHHGGQYPKGIRAPLIVRNTEDPGALGYTEPIKIVNGNTVADPDQEVITLSDWFADFWHAEERSVSLDYDSNNRSKGTCGTSTNKGIEYPPDNVGLYTKTDQNGIAQSDAARTISKICNEARRLRFINMSSHARFYVWFGDDREFDIVEMDGVTYVKEQSRMFEIAPGQRISIIVRADSNCAATHIIAASDPKVGHGTKRCPQLYTDPAKAIQFAYGYLNVGNNKAPRVMAMTDAAVVNTDRFTVFAASTVDENFHFYPSRSWEATTNKYMENRMKLYYVELFSNAGTDLADLKNYRYDFASDLGVRQPIGISDHHDFTMSPATTSAVWNPPRPTGASKYIHYVNLRGQSTGLSAMAENPVSGQTTWNAFASPEQSGESTDRTKMPKFPSLFRALQKGAPLDQRSTYTPDGSIGGGRTIMIPDNDETPHWFVLRSDLGDHPMHLHGHHFQVLAKLPKYWFDSNKASVIDLYDQVTSGALSTYGKPGPYSNPMRRDTLWIEKDIVYVIAIKPDNPGVWAFHCHNDIHAASGMFAQVIEKPGELQNLLGTWTGVDGVGGNQWSYTYTDPAAPKGKTALAAKVKELMNQALVRYGWGAVPQMQH